jgi:hypothetical protein
MIRDDAKNTDGSIVGIKVKLDRYIDREKPCHDNLAVVHPGKAQHVGEFRCAACGAHRGWLSQASRNLILETVRRFGAPPEPVLVRQEERTTMAFELRDNTASLFVNDRKTAQTHPDSTGSAKIGGVEYNVAAWRRESKNGKKYLSISFRRKDADAVDARSKPLGELLDDGIAF